MPARDLWKSFKEACGRFDVTYLDVVKANDLPMMEKMLRKHSYYLPRYCFTDEIVRAITPEMMKLTLSHISSDSLNRTAYNGQSRRGAYDPDPASRGFMMLGAVIAAGRNDLLPQFANCPINYNTGDARRHPVTAIMRSNSLCVDEKVEWVTIMASSGLGMVENKNEFADAARENKLQQLNEMLTRAGVYMGMAQPAPAVSPAAPPPVITAAPVAPMKPLTVRKAG